MITKLGQSIIAFLLTCIVGMLGWYLPTLSTKVDENQRMERTKLEQIYDIKTSTYSLKRDVSDIKTEMEDVKKKNDYIVTSVNGKIDTLISDTRLLCSQMKKYGDTLNWVDHPECRVKQ